MDNFTIVIFGALGDLTARKLMPSIFELAGLNRLSQHYRIICAGRQPFTDDSYREMIKEKVQALSPGVIENKEDFEIFCKNMFYVQMDFTDNSSCRNLKEEIEANEFVCHNIIYYLATPPGVAPDIIRNLHSSGLGGREQSCEGSRKIIIEKPYGSDLHSAKKLNQIVGDVFNEDQIYRIDHYLAKETVQNLLVFRFANGIFEPLWDRRYISHVEITIAEDFGIRHRGKYYEVAGLIRDIIQNHGLQLLSFIAMEPPVSIEADDIRNEKVKVFRSIRMMDPDEMKESVVIGQYEGYRSEDNVSSDSTVETFAAIKFLIDNWRWKDIPFYMRAGKCLSKTITEIVINFKLPPYDFFRRQQDTCTITNPDACVRTNRVILQIQPEESISISFGAKRPGEELIADTVLMEFDYRKSFETEGMTPYHRLLIDAIIGDQTRFIRKDGVERCWEIIDNIRSTIQDQEPLIYKEQTWGPVASNQLLAKDGFIWRLS